MGDEVVEGLGEQLVRGGEILLAMPEEHAGPVVKGSPSSLGHESGLTQTGLTRDEKYLAPLASRGSLASVGNRLHLRFAPDYAESRTNGQTARKRNGGSRASVSAAQRLPHDFDRIHRVGQPP